MKPGGIGPLHQGDDHNNFIMWIILQASRRREGRYRTQSSSNAAIPIRSEYQVGPCCCQGPGAGRPCLQQASQRTLSLLWQGWRCYGVPGASVPVRSSSKLRVTWALQLAPDVQKACNKYIQYFYGSTIYYIVLIKVYWMQLISELTYQGLYCKWVMYLSGLVCRNNGCKRQQMEIHS